MGISGAYNANENKLSFTCSESKAEQIRLALANFLKQDPRIWFSISFTKTFGNLFFPFDKNIGGEVYIAFGSLLSTSKFFIHDTPLNSRNYWTALVRNQHTFVIECHTNDESNSSVSLTLPMKSIDKTILVKESANYSEIILNIDVITTDIRTNAIGRKER